MVRISDIYVVAPHFKRRYSGVTSTIIQLIPKQAEIVGIATLGPGLPSGLPKIAWWQMPLLLRRPRQRSLRIWHARRNNEMLIGVVPEIRISSTVDARFHLCRAAFAQLVQPVPDLANGLRYCNQRPVWTILGCASHRCHAWSGLCSISSARGSGRSVGEQRATRSVRSRMFWPHPISERNRSLRRRDGASVARLSGLDRCTGGESDPSEPRVL